MTRWIEQTEHLPLGWLVGEADSAGHGELQSALLALDRPARGGRSAKFAQKSRVFRVFHAKVAGNVHVEKVPIS